MARPRVTRFDVANADNVTTFDANGNILRGLDDVTVDPLTYAQNDPFNIAYWLSGGAGSRTIGDTIGPPIVTVSNAASNAVDAAGNAANAAGDFIQSIKDTLQKAADTAGTGFNMIFVLALLGGAIYLVSKFSKD